jgi:uncharacterized protein (DUF4415 family)
MDSKKFVEQLETLMKRSNKIIKESKPFQNPNNKKAPKHLMAVDADVVRLFKKAGVKSN